MNLIGENKMEDNKKVPDDKTEDIREALIVAKQRAFEAEKSKEEIKEEEIQEKIQKEVQEEKKVQLEEVQGDAREIPEEEAALKEEEKLSAEEKSEDKESTDTKDTINFKRIWNAFIHGAIFQTIVIIIGLSICAAIGVGLAVLENVSDPVNVANEYFKAYVKGNFDEMYKYVDIDESRFITGTAYAAFMKQQRSECEFGEFEIGLPVNYKNTSVIEVNYFNELTQKDEMFTINMAAYRDNWYQLVPDWKIVIDDYLTDKFAIYAVKGATVYMDGINIADLYKETVSEKDKKAFSEDNAEFDKYIINELYCGEHTIYAETDFGECTVIKKINDKNEEVLLTFDQMELKAEATEAIAADAESTIENLYKLCMTQDKSYKKILDDYAAKADVKKQVKNVVKKIRSKLYDDEIRDIEKYFISSLEFGEIQTSIEYNAPDKIFVVSEFSYDYSASMDTTYYNSYTGEYSGKINATVNFSYELNEGEWVITSVTVKNKNQK